MPEKKWYEIKAAANDSAEIWIYEQIGEDWWSGEGVTAKNFCKELAALKVTAIDLHINSPGGSVFDGQAIYNALKRHPANVTVYIDGIAASIASVIALAGNSVVMAANALFMIHNPWGMSQGSADDMRKYADLLDKVRETIVSVYREKCGLDDAAIIAAMDAETWMTAEEAQAFGFVDQIGDELKLAACFDLKQLGFRNVPQAATVKVEVEVDSSNTSLESDTEQPGCYCTGCTPEMTCPDCPDQATCINPGKTSAAAAATTQAPAAEILEVVTMSTVPTAPANGAARNIQAEAAEIAALCNANKCPEKIADFISAGVTPDQAARQILDLLASGALATPAAEHSGTVDLDKQAGEYSFQNALKAAVDLREGRSASGLEFEIHQQLAKAMPKNYEAKGGIIVPMRIKNTSLTTSGSTSGSELVRTGYGDLIEMLRNTSVTGQLGASILSGLTGPLTFPKQTGASTLVWNGEAGSAVAESNVALTTVTLSPKTALAKGSLSRNLLYQSTPDAELLIRNDLGQVAALGIDRAALHGTGNSNQPSGVYATSNINAKAMGGAPTFGKLVDMATECAIDNALLGNLGFATTPGMSGKLMQTLVASAAGSSMIWSGNHVSGNVAGYKSIASNQVSSVMTGSTVTGGSEHGIIFGNWSEMLIGQWGGIEITVDPYTLADQGLIRLIMFLMVDIQFRHPEAFCKATGATI